MSERDNQARAQFAEKTWDGLEPMIRDYAATACAIAAEDFHQTLDYGPPSVERLEAILNRLSPAPDPLPAGESDWLSLLWGSYFGELLRHLHGGDWTMTIYPQTEFSVPTLQWESGSRVYPMMKVHRRLSLGASESLPAFYRMFCERLGAGPASRR